MKQPLICVLIALPFGIAWMRENKHDYIVTYQTQTNGSMDWATTETLTRGEKWTKADYRWFKTNCVSGATNVSVLILNIIKLDD